MNLLFHHPPSSPQQSSLSHKPGSQPVSKESVSPMFNNSGEIRRSEPHYGSEGQSSNYMTMQNVDRLRSESFKTIEPIPFGINHTTIPPIPTPTTPPPTNPPLQLLSNIIHQQIPQHLSQPINQPPPPFPQPRPKRQYHYLPQQDPIQQQHNYKFQYIELKTAYEGLKEAHERLQLDYNGLVQRQRAMEHNQEAVVIGNEELVRKNVGLVNRVNDLQREIQGLRMLGNGIELHNSMNIANQPNLRPYTPINLLSISNPMQPLPLRQLQHQNRQLLFRIQQYQSTILYKNSQIQKNQSQLKSQQVQILSLRREVESYLNKEKLQREEKQRKLIFANNSRQNDETIIKMLKQQLQKLQQHLYNLKSQHTLHTQTLNRQHQTLLTTHQSQLNLLQQQKKHLQSTIQQLRSSIELLEKTNVNYLERVRHLEGQNAWQVKVIENFSVGNVVRTYIGEEVMGGKGKDRETKFGQINEAVYKGLKNHMGKKNNIYTNTNTPNANHISTTHPNPKLTKTIYNSLTSNPPTRDFATLSYTLANNPPPSYNPNIPANTILENTDKMQNVFHRHSQSMNNGSLNIGRDSNKLKIEDQAFYDFGKEYAQGLEDNAQQAKITQKLYQNLSNNANQGYMEGNQVLPQQFIQNDQIPPVSYQDQSQQPIKQFTRSKSLHKLSTLLYPNAPYQNTNPPFINQPQYPSNDILSFPQLPFRPQNLTKHSHLMTTSNLANQSLQRSTSPTQIRPKHHPKIFQPTNRVNNDRSDSFPNQHTPQSQWQRTSLENLQKRIIELTQQNKGLKKFLVKKQNQ